MQILVVMASGFELEVPGFIPDANKDSQSTYDVHTHKFCGFKIL